MTREEKVLKRKERAKRRADKHNEKYRNLSRQADWKNCPIVGLKGGSWPDSNSPTGYMQVCDWAGHCQSPCNGDC